MRNWEPDVEVDCAIAHRIVSSQFAAFASQTPVFLGRGWDNYCIEYPDGTVFRLPTRQLGGVIVRNEILALPIIHRAIRRISVPNLEYVGVPQGGYPYPFVGYAKVPGRTADQVDWSPQDRLAAASALGGFLQELHAIDLDQAGLGDLPRDDPAKADPLRILEKLRARAEPVVAKIGARTPGMLRAVEMAEDVAGRPPQPYKSRLLHGDLYPRHVLAENGVVTGIIDWGDVQVGDPAVDLSIAYTFFELEERPTFWAAYGRSESEFNRPVMIVRAAMYGFALLAYGAEEGDLPAFKMGQQIVSRSKDWT